MRILAVLALIVVAVAAAIVSLQPRIDDVVETLDAENATLRIRIENRIETCSWFPCLTGAYYVFLSSPKGVERWRAIMTFRHDDPGPAPRDNVRFVDERVAFVFMGWMFAVTTDGGANWSVWDATEDLPGWRCCNHGLIKAVQIEANGAGTMTLNPIEHRQGEIPALSTRDYGHSWKAGASR